MRIKDYRCSVDTLLKTRDCNISKVTVSKHHSKIVCKIEPLIFNVAQVTLFL